MLVGGVRHPFARLLSLYFYPGSWTRPRFPGARELSLRFPAKFMRIFARHETPFWDEERFVRLVADTQPMSDYFRDTAGTVRPPDVAISAANINECAAILAERIGIPHLSVPHINRSLRPAEIKRLGASTDLAKFVQESHAVDYTTFEFSLFE